jgi:hypothetical protein
MTVLALHEVLGTPDAGATMPPYQQNVMEL